jgi:hypothetical protein
MAIDYDEVMAVFVLWGRLRVENPWKSWYEFCCDFISSLGLQATHLEVIGGPFKGSSVLQVKRTRRRLQGAFDSRAAFSTLGVYSLPDDFRQAVFDYHVFMLLTAVERPSVFVATSSDRMSAIDIDCLHREFSRFVEPTSGELFQSARGDSYLTYIDDGCSREDLDTFRLLQEY